MWHWRRRNADFEQMLEAILSQVALLHEAVVLHLGPPPPAAPPEPVPPLLLAALAAPSRDGDLLRLHTNGHDFLVVTGPGTAEPEAVWAQACAVAVACAVAPLTSGEHEVVHLGYRPFPAPLRAVAVCNAHGDLLAWVSAFLSPPEQRAALRRLVRADPGGRNALPLAAPFLLMLRHPARTALGGAAALAGATAAVTGITVPAYHAPPSLAAPPVTVTHTPARPPHAAQAPLPHRGGARHGQQPGGSMGVPAQRERPPGEHPAAIPAPSPSSAPPPLAVHPGRACVRVLGATACARL